MSDRKAFGALLRAARQRAGMRTLADFAAQLQISGIAYSESALQAWETGMRVPDREVLLRVCALLAARTGFETLEILNAVFYNAGYHAVSAEEIAAYFPTLRPNDLVARLPPHPPYRRLIGRDPVLERLVPIHENHKGYAAATSADLGGIGKTALAYEALHRVVQTDRYHGLVWAVAKQEEFIGVESFTRVGAPIDTQAILAAFAEGAGIGHLQDQPTPQLQAALKLIFQEQRFLIYLDNLETVPQSRAFAVLLHDLIAGSGSRVLLTSRESLADFAFVREYRIEGLPEAAALQLLREEASERGAETLLKATPDLLHQLYATTEGMPLAIKLIVSQYLLGIALDDELLRLRATAPEQEFFRFIYATLWNKLTPDARHFLIGLAAFPTWTLRAILQPVIAQEDVAFVEAVAELSRMSLLNVQHHPQLAHQLYDLHSMTRWFVNGPLAAAWS